MAAPAHGVARAIEVRGWILEMLNRLIDTHVALQLVPWSVSDALTLFIDKLMRTIVGIETPLDRLEGHLKASLDETIQDRLDTVEVLRTETHEEATVMADLVMRAIEADRIGRS